MGRLVRRRQSVWRLEYQLIAVCKVKQFIQFGDMRQFISTLCTIYHLDSSLVFVDYGWMDNGSFWLKLQII